MRESSSHLRSWPEATTALACCSRPARMTISCFQFGDGSGGGGLIDQRFFQVLLLLGVQVVVVLGQHRPASRRELLAADAELLLAQAAFEAFAGGA